MDKATLPHSFTSKDVQLARRDHVGLAVHVRWNIPPWPDVLCFPHGPPRCTWLLSSHGAAGVAADLNLRFDVSQLILVSVATCEQRLLCWVVGEREDGERSRRSWAHRESSLGKGWACRSEVRGGLRRGWTGAQRTSEVRRLKIWGGAPRQRALGGQRTGGRADGPTVGLGRGVLLRWECCSGGNAAGDRVEPPSPRPPGLTLLSEAAVQRGGALRSWPDLESLSTRCADPGEMVTEKEGGQVSCPLENRVPLLRRWEGRKGQAGPSLRGRGLCPWAGKSRPHPPRSRRYPSGCEGCRCSLLRAPCGARRGPRDRPGGPSPGEEPLELG
ncbi:uncharacterized protein LOC103020911 [Balaenoptera acutorostrata]|uniref:Uncharacterized protein LOC103020911 n=1 Tax=Balaenoptera acutorostrata TaxID=9767 RepID=A0ABM3S8N1_BALAC|nr:uncharacterized protein LOC103020911 [Balaenoptera acutorostrata]